MTTSFTGESQVGLVPGRYRIRSAAPVQFGLRRLQWDVLFEVKGAGPMTVELSNDNAIVETPPAGAFERPSSNATEIFQTLRDAVVTIESEGAQGTGFMVDDRGLLLTSEAHFISKRSSRQGS